MKKLLLFLSVMLISLSASAQFTVYKPVIVDKNGNWVNRNDNNSNNYNPNNDNIYNFSTPQRSQQQQQQQSPAISIRGYYNSNDQWKSVLIKVQIIDKKVYVVGIKRQTTGWSNEKTRAYSTELMEKEIKDNFDYYIGDYVYGKIYF